MNIISLVCVPRLSCCRGLRISSTDETRGCTDKRLQYVICMLIGGCLHGTWKFFNFYLTFFCIFTWFCCLKKTFKLTTLHIITIFALFWIYFIFWTKVIIWFIPQWSLINKRSMFVHSHLKENLFCSRIGEHIIFLLWNVAFCVQPNHNHGINVI